MIVQYIRNVVTAVGKIGRIRIIALLAAVFLMTLMIYSAVLLSGREIYQHISINGINVSGLSKSEAMKLVDAQMKLRNRDGIILLKYGDARWGLRYSDIRFSYLTEEAVDKAYKIGRSGNPFKRLGDIIGLRLDNRDINLETSIDKQLLEKKLLGIKSLIDKKSKDAGLLYKNGKMIFSNEVIGRLFDVDKNMKLIENYIWQGNFKEIDLKVESIEPRLKYENIKDIDGVLSAFSTSFKVSDSNRTENIKLACSRINGVVLLPGETLSLNEKLGSRTVENGYKNARVIVNNEFVNGVGGGVCQLATTLYDAVLLSKLGIVERTHHSIPSTYVFPGQDATIAEGYIDFKFKNNKEYPVSINASASDGNIVIRILGRKKDIDGVVKLKSDIIKVSEPVGEDYVIDNSLEDYERVVTQKASSGMKVAVYRFTYDKSGKLMNKEKISEDYYNPVKAKIKVNSNYLNMTDIE